MYLLLVAIFVCSVNGIAIKKDQFQESKITGGDYDVIENHPSLVAIINDDGMWCGGSIVSKYHVLTAAHCVMFSSSKLVVRAGSSFWAGGGSLHAVEYNVTYGHQVYTDLAVLRVTQPFQFDNTRQVISLFYPHEQIDAGTLGIIVGWGTTEDTGYSNKMKVAQIPIIDRNVCNNIYNNTDVGPITDGRICAGDLEKGSMDSCQGDSGGPLIIDGRQAGIVSMGEGCGNPKYPGVYTEIAFYNEWILEEISL